VERIVVGEAARELRERLAGARIGVTQLLRERPQRQQRLGPAAQALDVLGI
jgi:hypothetical protein